MEPDTTLVSEFPEPPTAHRMIPDFTESLLSASTLRAIHFGGRLSELGGSDIFGYLDDLESKATHTGIIRSFRNGGDELLHARFFGRYIESPSMLDHSLTAPPPRPLRSITTILMI